MTEPATPVDYLDLEDLLATASAYLGRPAQVRDYGLLESAAARPQAMVFGTEAYPTIHEKAAALLDSLVNNHALVDGNKRLGWVATRLFYTLNGYAISATEDQKFDLVIAVATNQFADIPALARQLAEFAQPG